MTMWGILPRSPPDRLPAWSVAAAAVRDGVNVVAAQGLVGPVAPGPERLVRRSGRDECITAAADQVCPPRLFQRLADLEVVLRFEELHERPLQLAVPQLAGHIDLLLRERIEAGVVHARGDVLAYLHKDQYIGH